MMARIGWHFWTHQSCSPASRSGSSIGIFFAVLFLAALANTACAQQASPNTTWAVTIVLPPRLVAGRPATLALLGVDGRLADGVAVEVGGPSGSVQHVKTDKTGRAVFDVPSAANVLIAKASGASAAALIDAQASADALQTISLAPVISMQDQFSICGGKFQGDEDSNHVVLNDDPALVLAASPECLVILPGPRVIPGPAKISIESAAAQWNVASTLVALHFDPPLPALVPEKKSRLTVHVQGSGRPLNIEVENKSPGVLRFLRGDVQVLSTSGGSQNLATIEVLAIRSGDFSFHARLLLPPDAGAARRYLEAAQPLAPKDLERRVKSVANRLMHHPGDTEKATNELDVLLYITIAGDFRTLLLSARAALE
jgi:hypothetical protein